MTGHLLDFHGIVHTRHSWPEGKEQGVEPIKLTDEEWACAYEQLMPIVDRLSDEQRRSVLEMIRWELFGAPQSQALN